MKMVVVITAVVLGLSGLSTAAENAGPARRGPAGPRGQTRVAPHVRADTNANGVIDADERPGLRGRRGKGGEGRGRGEPGPGGEGRGKGGPGPGGEGRGKGGPGSGGRGQN